jgi:hypothetical protein
LKKAIHIMVWIVSVAGLAVLALGVCGGLAQLVGWTAPENVIAAQIALSLVTTLALLSLSLVAIYMKGMRRVGIFGVIDAFVIPVLLTQEIISNGRTFWLVQATYLLIGIDVLTVAQIMKTRSQHL